MEALIVVLLDALVGLFAPLAATIAVACAGLAAVLFASAHFLLECILRWLRSRSAPPAGASPIPPPPALPPASPPSAARRRWVVLARRLLVAGAGAGVLLLLALVAVDRWYLGDLVRMLLEHQRQRTGIAISLTAIDGSLFSGRLLAENVIITLNSHGSSDLALTVRTMAIRLPPWRILMPTLVIDELHINGVRGSVLRGNSLLAPFTPAPGGAAGSAGTTTDAASASAAPARPPRHWTILDLTASDIDITYADRTHRRPLVLPLAVDTLRAAPLRGSHAVFDLL